MGVRQYPRQPGCLSPDHEQMGALWTPLQQSAAQPGSLLARLQVPSGPASTLTRSKPPRGPASHRAPACGAHVKAEALRGLGDGSSRSFLKGNGWVGCPASLPGQLGEGRWVGLESHASRRWLADSRPPSGPRGRACRWRPQGQRKALGHTETAPRANHSTPDPWGKLNRR